MAPYISVVMSVYNGERFLAEAIDSIATQTFSDFEFLIINDCSTDGSRAMVQACSDPRIRLIDNERNLGLAASLNRGLEQARGSYIARMDADDVAEPDRLDKQIEYMEKNPDIDVCGSWYAKFGNRNAVARTPVHDRDIKDSLFFHNCIAHSTVMLRKQTVVQYALTYSGQFRYAQDYELWCREIDRLKFFNLPEVLLRYRLHDSQIRAAKETEQAQATDAVRKRNLERLGLHLSADDRALLDAVIRGRVSESGDWVLRAVKILDEIGRRGKSMHGQMFVQKVRDYMRQCAEAGIGCRKTSLAMFARILYRWNTYPTFRGKLRYVYHACRNLTGEASIQP
jgi:glycosyltransferase involved in cell wall biosynthesis